MAKESIIKYFKTKYSDKFISIKNAWVLPTKQYCINAKFITGEYFFIIDNGNVSHEFETIFDALESVA